MTTVMEQRIEYALEYASYGWHVVPLYHRLADGACSCSKGKGCGKSTGKHPRVGKNWQNKASIDEEQIIAWWEQWPQANVGVQLGRRSGIIDIECDTKQAEKELIELFGGEVPICPTYQSSRGKHRIFQWCSDLPGGASEHAGEVELRLGNGDLGAQSVFPPSIHWSGKKIKWVQSLSTSEIEPPPLPAAVVAKIWNLSGESPIGDGKVAKSTDHWKKILDGRPEGDRHNSMTSLIGYLLQNQNNLTDTIRIQVLWQSVVAINERNSPPLDAAELQSIFTGLLNKEGNRRTTEDTSELMIEPVEQQISPQDDTGEMRLVIVESDPKIFELHSPHFKHADGGCLSLTKKEMCNGAVLRMEALEQARYPMSREFAKAWDARTKNADGTWKPSLYQSLVRNAELRKAPLEQRRPLVVAERFRDAIKTPQILEEGQEPNKNGRPCRMQDGSIVFRFNAIWEEMCMGADQIQKIELSRVLQKTGAAWKAFSGTRFKRLDKAAQRALHKLLDEAD